MSLYLGLMSGTSMDGVDAALVSFENNDIAMVDSLTASYPTSLQSSLRCVIEPKAKLTLAEFGELNVKIGRAFADAANQLLRQTNVSKRDVRAIGSHGQTLFHHPFGDPAYTIQIGDPATIAHRCSIATVADFRSLDIAAGGQGAPLVPPFHDACLRQRNTNTVVVNIGGIANISVLPADSRNPILGFDTGPGNCLLDEWINLKRGEAYDKFGRWAASGSVSQTLLAELMRDEYLHRPAPKSTGREYFNSAFLNNALKATQSSELKDEDVQATLAEFTVKSIALGIEQSGLEPQQILVCGGGAKNECLMRSLRAVFPGAPVQTTQAFGVDPDMIEAMAFAWLAKQRINLIPVRLTTDDSQREQILGAVYQPFATL